MDVQEDELPYKAEYSKSSRASCRNCKLQIQKDMLRLAAMVQSPVYDGMVPTWYHLDCFFEKQRPKSVGDIAHIESLRFEDQEKIKSLIVSSSGPVVPDAKGKKRTAGSSNNKALNDFCIEYAKSSRAVCRGCENKIMKDEVRISKKDFESDIGKRYGGQDKWHHVTCFAKCRDELLYYETGEKLPGFKSLKADDQKFVKEQIPAIKQLEENAPSQAKIPKIKDETDGGPNKSKLKSQSQTMFKYRDLLKKDLNKTKLQTLLEYNNQEIPVGIESILDLLCDIMTFGALEKCPICKGQFIFSKNGYSCQGNVTEWAKCQNFVKEPARKPFKVPKVLSEAHPFLKSYKFKPGTRLFQYVPPTESIKKENDTEPKVKVEKPALSEMKFLITGFKSDKKDELTKEIVKRGGKVEKKFGNVSLMAVISNKDEMEKMEKNRYLKEAKIRDIHVVSEDFIFKADSYKEIPELVKKMSICDWGLDPSARMPIETKSVPKKSKSMFSKSLPKSVKMQIKGGGVVDPDSGLQDVAHVYQEGKDKYTTVLSKTNIQKKKNSFYKLQILKADKKDKYWVFRAWGRIGTTIGGNKVDKMSTLFEAKQLFNELYEEKTGNSWRNRTNFVKMPDLFYPVEVDEAENEELIKIEDSIKPSKLEKPIQNLVRMIFDVNEMKKVMLEYELDMEKMPLGKLSKKQIQRAYSVLAELQNLVDTKTSQHGFIDLSNKFYTYIPHSFGNENPPILNNAELIKEKLDMLNNLMDLEISYNLMKNCHAEGGDKTVDGYYDQLKTEILLLEKTSEEYKLIETYVKNTHAATHSHYTLEIEEVFVIKRHGEDKRYRPFKKLHNRKLLWHGSRTSNYAGILSQGLRIAPPEAPVTGYMFGKGIYFADMVSKSANYCCVNSSNSTGLMLLCEVALGDMYERHKADFIEKLPDGKHSCKGVGKTHPNPKESVVKNGVEIPLGKGTETKVRSDLLYNEYIVYDVAQVNVRYLLKMNFKYHYFS